MIAIAVVLLGPIGMVALARFAGARRAERTGARFSDAKWGWADERIGGMRAGEVRNWWLLAWTLLFVGAEFLLAAGQ
ncbi:MAG TPA: hypothetical protein VLU43_14165 [Anaeromyxobacteraceae bacterium]|nr:hypothetical protein [Anaeromyxobacteraceae bacterium]